MNHYDELRKITDFKEWFKVAKKQELCDLRQFYRKVTPGDIEDALGENFLLGQKAMKIIFGDRKEKYTEPGIDEFARFGIYDYTVVFDLDYDDEFKFYYSYPGDEKVRVMNLDGLFDCEALMKILDLTIYSGRPPRYVLERD